MRLMRVLASSLAATLACNDDARKDEGAGETGATTTTSTGGPMMTGTTGGATSTAEGAPMTAATTEAAAGALDDECAAYCAKIDACHVDPEWTTCMSECIEDLTGIEAQCLPVYEDLLECGQALNCEEIGIFYNGQPGPCADELAAEEASGCGLGGCGADVVSDGVAECSASLQCTGEPVHEMQCKGDLCVCLVDGVERGDSCPAEMICQQDFEMMSDKASRCCGFDLEPDWEEPPRALGPSL